MGKEVVVASGREVVEYAGGIARALGARYGVETAYVQDVCCTKPM